MEKMSNESTIADNEMSAGEEDLIVSAVRIFNFSDEAYQKLKSQYIQTFDKYYAILQSVKHDTDDHIKKQYRKLAKQYHPDKIISKGLPEEFNQLRMKNFAKSRKPMKSLGKKEVSISFQPVSISKEKSW